MTNILYFNIDNLVSLVGQTEVRISQCQWKACTSIDVSKSTKIVNTKLEKVDRTPAKKFLQKD